MLESASGSLPNHPGHPPAASGGLVSLVPDLVLGPRKPLDIGELQQPGRRGTTRFFGTSSRVPMDWAASAIKVWAPGPQIDERRTRNMTRVAKGQSAPRRGDVVLTFSDLRRSPRSARRDAERGEQAEHRGSGVVRQKVV